MGTFWCNQNLITSKPKILNRENIITALGWTKSGMNNSPNLDYFYVNQFNTLTLAYYIPFIIHFRISSIFSGRYKINLKGKYLKILLHFLGKNIQFTFLRFYLKENFTKIGLLSFCLSITLLFLEMVAFIDTKAGNCESRYMWWVISWGAPHTFKRGV